jgi:hypothetical protein
MIALHRSPYSGSWYPGDAEELRELVDRLFEEADRRTGKYILPDGLGFVTPHAGLAYSGTVAASIYRRLHRQGVRRVLLAGFSHSHHFSGIRMPEIAAYSTPSGETATDLELMRELARHAPFHLAQETLLCDHSVEIQLPLLEAAVPEARVVPLLVGNASAGDIEMAAERLAPLLLRETVMVASSDFTHYGTAFGHLPFPNDGWVQENLRELDELLMEAAGSLDCGFFQQELRRLSATLCGRGPISLLLATLSKVPGDEVFQENIDYQTSGEITGDWGHSVSYAALGYYPASAFFLSSEEQQLVLESVRRTLSTYSAEGRCEPVLPERNTPAMEHRRGVFVSLHHKGRLLGCIGCREGAQPLLSAAPELALSALDDPRFHRPLPAEIAEADYEVSVLTPMKRLADPKNLRVGVHGALMDAGGRQGLLLPQVATEHHLDQAAFLRALARKAGVDPEALRHAETKLMAFQAQRFSGHGTLEAQAL